MQDDYGLDAISLLARQIGYVQYAVQFDHGFHTNRIHNGLPKPLPDKVPVILPSIGLCDKLVEWRLIVDEPRQNQKPNDQ